MSITLNRFPVLPTNLYGEDMFARPSASVASFISGFRHSVLGSPVVVACIVVNVMMVYYIVIFFMKKVSWTPFVVTLVLLTRGQNHIPAVGYPSWLGPWAGAIRFFYDSRRIINEGYRKVRRTFILYLYLDLLCAVQGSYLPGPSVERVDVYHHKPEMQYVPTRY